MPTALPSAQETVVEAVAAQFESPLPAPPPGHFGGFGGQYVPETLMVACANSKRPTAPPNPTPTFAANSPPCCAISPDARRRSTTRPV